MLLRKAKTQRVHQYWTSIIRSVRESSLSENEKATTRNKKIQKEIIQIRKWGKKKKAGFSTWILGESGRGKMVGRTDF